MRGIAAAAGLAGVAIGVIAGALLFAPGEAPAPEAAATAVEAQPPVRWRVASTFPLSLVLLGEQGKRLERQLEAVSGGEVRLRFYEPGALVPALEVFDAVSAGSVDAGWSASSYWAGKIPALQFFNSVPFGPPPGELLAWMRYGGGRELYEDLYRPHNIHPVTCFFVPQDGSGWFRRPIEKLEDFAGLKVRFLGLGALVLEKFGASTQLLAAGDIYPALELGTIDAAEFAMPAIDRDLGLHQIAKHYYLPGWHQPANMGELIVNRDRWQALDPARRSLIETACGDNVLDSIAYGEATQFPALHALQAEGVTLHRWPPEFLAAFEAAWQEVVAAQAAADADFDRVWRSLSAFRADYEIWRDYGRLD